MKRILIMQTSLLLVLVSGCTSLKRTDECKSYYSYVKDGWHQKENGFFEFKKKPSYAEKKTEYGQMINVGCLVGIGKRDIVKLFGKPTVDANNRYEYYTNEGCYREDKCACLRLVLVLDEKGNVESVRPFAFEAPPSGCD